MLRIHNLARFPLGVRSIRATGTRPWLLARTSRTITSRQSSVEHQDKLTGTETPQVEPLPDGSRPSWIYYGVFALGVGLTAYGIYSVYELKTMWPKAIRGDLRDGIKYRNQGNLTLSIHYLKKVWEETKSLSLDLFKPDPLLKTTGIAIVLAGVLEDDGKKEEAYDVYKEAFLQILSAYIDLPRKELPSNTPQHEIEMETETLKRLTGPERMRVAAIAYKLGCMAPDVGKLDEEEKWLTLAVIAVLTSVMKTPEGPGMEKVVGVPSSALDSEPNNVMWHDFRLPSWSKMHDLAAPFEALGTYYSKHGHEAYALHLYLQAVSILIPPPPMTTSAVDRCRGAQLMGTISGLILAVDLSGNGAETFVQAMSWAQKGLDLVIATRQSHPNEKLDECETAYLSLLFNMAMLWQSSDENAKARELYEACLKQSNAMGLEILSEHAQKMLQDVDSKLCNKDKIDS